MVDLNPIHALQSAFKHTVPGRAHFEPVEPDEPQHADRPPAPEHDAAAEDRVTRRRP